jgi:Zn-finger nucleic acid-binding protein
VRGCGPTHATRVGGVLVHECGVCHGTWIPENRLEELVGRIGRGTVTLASSHLESAVHTEVGRIEYRRCPLCKAHMARRNFQRISGVVVDRCHEHGTWLDADELPRIAAFVSEGGLVKAAAARDEERARLARSAAFRARIEATTPHHARTELNVSMARSFSQVFQKLLSGDHGGD